MWGFRAFGLVTYPLKTQKSIVSPPQAPKPYSLNSLSTERPQALIPEPKLHNPSQSTWEAIGRQKYSNLALNLRTALCGNQGSLSGGPCIEDLDA